MATGVVCFVLISVLFAAFASIPSTEAQLITSNVVINEFEQNPPGDERDTGGEFVELFNPTGSSVDISGWTLTTTHGDICSYTIPSGTTLDKGPYCWVVTFSGQCIDNYDPDSVVLRDKSGREVDRTPAKTDTTSDTSSWQRIPDAGTSWEFTMATKDGYNAPNPVPEFPNPFLPMLAVMLVLVVMKAGSRLRKPIHCTGS